MVAYKARYGNLSVPFSFDFYLTQGLMSLLFLNQVPPPDSTVQALLPTCGSPSSALPCPETHMAHSSFPSGLGQMSPPLIFVHAHHAWNIYGAHHPLHSSFPSVQISSWRTSLPVNTLYSDLFILLHVLFHLNTNSMKVEEFTFWFPILFPRYQKQWYWINEWMSLFHNTFMFLEFISPGQLVNYIF